MFKNVTTTSVVAVMLIGGSFFLLGYFAVRYGGDATTRTQIITGLLTSIAAVTGYYFGSAKQHTVPGTSTVDISTSTPTPDNGTDTTT